MNDDGAVALEVVLVVPLVALLVLAVLGTTAVVTDQLAATRAARAAARAVALSGELGRADAAAAAVDPSAVVTARLRRGVVEVQVRLTGDVLGLDYAVDAAASAALEPVAW